MRRNLATVLAIMLAFASASVLALGLGEIRLNSYLNQRLDAEIELVSASAEELQSLEVRLADRKTFERQGIPRLPELSSLQFNIVRRPNGTSYIKVTSKEPMKEPFLTFLIEIEWSNGRLLREYTLLLDPPTFKEDREAIRAQQQTSAPAVPAEEPAASSEPTPADILRGEPATAPAEDEQPVQMAEEESGDAVSVPALEEDAGQVARPVRQEPQRSTSQDLGGNYGPIQRSETLWGIAQRLRPDSSITMNQMMLAIYRANPEAFLGNINRMKAGYILRIPDYDEITSLTASEAFREAKRQNEEWRGDDRGSAMFATETEDAPVEDAEPSLSLVAPEESDEPEVGMGEEEIGAGGESGMADSESLANADPEDDVDTGAVDLGVEESGDERLGDVESETLQAMQDSESTLPDTESAMSEEGGAAADEELDLPPLPGDEADSEMAAADDSVDDSTEAGAEETGTESAAGVAETDAAADEATASPQQDLRTAAPARPAPKPSLVDQALDFVLAPIGMAIAGVVLLVLILLAVLMRKRRSDAAKQASAEMSGWDAADFDSDDDDATIVADDGSDAEEAASDSDDEDDFQGMFGSDADREEDTGTQRLEDDAEATQMLSDADRASAEKEAEEDFTDTLVGGETQMLDENDPLSEADFHMAYGLYDQAAEVVEKAIGSKPDSKELKVKLAEIHFAADNKEGFIQAAQSLHDQIGSDDADWNNIAIMGRQIAGDNPLFAEGGGSSSVDLDFAAAGEDEGGAESAGESLDFDIPSETPSADETAQADSGSSDEIDFDMDFGDSGSAETSAAPEQDDAQEASSAASTSGDDLDFDLNLGESDEASDADSADELDTAISDDADTQTEFDKALQELSAYVDTNAPDKGGQATEEAKDDLSLDEFSFDDEPESGGGDDELGDDESDELGEIGTKLDLARAYIDMGDPDGARSILEEVVAEGDDEQKKEAQELIDQLG